MRRVLVRSGKSPLEALGPEATLGASRAGLFAGNVGNYLFTDAVHRLLSVAGTEVVSDAYSTERRGVPDAHLARINEEFDHLVLPLANAFRTSYVDNLSRLTRVVESLQIPVSVVGVGAHLPLVGARSAPREAVAVYTRFVRAVLEKSPSIGVRGHFTKEFVEGLGFDADQVEVIGCPSIYLRGPEHRVRENTGSLQTTDPVALNLTVGHSLVLSSQYPAFFARHLERFSDSTYIGQVSAELAMLLWGRYDGPPVSDLRLPFHPEHRLHREDRIRFFVDSKPWLEFLGTRRFSVGTRIHGTIAGVLGGTPSFLVAHDPRTRELAEYHEIPYRPIQDIDGDSRTEDLYDACDYSAFNAGMEKRWEVLTSFLDRHGLEHVGRPDADGSAFDRAWDETPKPPGVRSLHTEQPELGQLLGDRMTWLRQGVEVDRGLIRGRDRTESFTPVAAPPPDVRQTVAALARDVSRLRTRVEKLDARVERLRARNARQAEQLRKLSGRRRSLLSRVRARVSATLSRS
jgi:hypothetical protein